MSGPNNPSSQYGTPFSTPGSSSMSRAAARAQSLPFSAARAGSPPASCIDLPTPVLNIAGYELEGEYQRIDNTEMIDQKRYAGIETTVDENGALEWILAAYEDEKVNNPDFQHVYDHDTWVHYCDSTLASTIPKVLNILAKRDSLAIAVSKDIQLASAIKAYGKEAQTRHPSIYVRQIVVGPDQRNLTVEEAENIARFIRQYASARV